ncbi:DUF4270 family protein [Dyadobacter sp. CY323]|uniref:DUF4270 family protein n=1 Tax=Dyadobacter sp. CY323 TaxID=2907302 RepID=UPI001F192449|nr:DUF4270 family protein [Dyadobacter sp. CY323]MCE6992594.1 DUF4270 domain-containing protein [Dyadobacter sp. CY323]
MLFSKGTSTAYKLLFIIGFSVSLAGCNWGDEIESLVQPNPDDFAVLFSDTSTVELSTVLSDSVMTGAPARLLVGRYVDPYFGKIQTAAFFQPTTQSGVTIPDKAEYDSLVLSLNYDLYTYGDTTKPLNITVHKLLADILSKDSYYNGNSTAFDANPLGKVKISPMPRRSKRLVIRLSDGLGAEIFEKGKTNLLTSNQEWINLVNGILVKAGASDNGAVVGFQANAAYVQVHFHVPDVDAVRKDSVVFQSTAFYNQIISDRSGTATAKLSSNQRVSTPSSQTGNMAFVQAGLSIMTRIDLPTVRQLSLTKYTVANRAFLRITPDRSSVTNQLNAPPALHVFRVNKNNEFYLNSQGFPLPLYNLTTGQLKPIVGQYVQDYVNNKQFYLLDVSSYVTEVMNSETGDVGGLVLVTSETNENDQFRPSRTYPFADRDFTKSLDRLVIGDQHSNNPGVKLELYYTTVKVK